MATMTSTSLNHKQETETFIAASKPENQIHEATHWCQASKVYPKYQEWPSNNYNWHKKMYVTCLTSKTKENHINLQINPVDKFFGKYFITTCNETLAEAMSFQQGHQRQI